MFTIHNKSVFNEKFQLLGKTFFLKVEKEGLKLFNDKQSDHSSLTGCQGTSLLLSLTVECTLSHANTHTFSLFLTCSPTYKIARTNTQAQSPSKHIDTTILSFSLSLSHFSTQRRTHSLSMCCHFSIFQPQFVNLGFEISFLITLFRISFSFLSHAVKQIKKRSSKCQFSPKLN